MRTSLILIGGGGHCKSIIDIIESGRSYDIAGIVERDRERIGQKLLGHAIIGTDQDLYLILDKNKNFIVTIGQIKNSSLRKNIYDKATKIGGIPTSIVSKNAHVSQHSIIGKGVSIGHFSTINANSKIGNNTIINNHVLIEHDSIIGDHCHVSTSSTINGNVTVGNNVFIGSNSTLLQGVSISSHCIIGACTLVNKSLHEPGTYIGTPAKKIK